MEKKTKIVVTLSLMKCDVEFIEKLYHEGANVIRLNTAHLTIKEALNIIQNVRKVSDKIAIIIDTKGPEIRTCKSDYIFDLQKGDTVKIKGDHNGVSDHDFLYVTHDNFVNEVSIGDQILIDDGDIELDVIRKEGDALICKVINHGLIKGRKSVNVPRVKFNLPALSYKDREFIDFAIEQDIDFIAHSFVRNRQDVLGVQQILDGKNSRIKIIAKIENQEGVDNIDEILENVYGIMVARGDLAIEIPYEQIPGIQKRIINKCINARKPVIIATQMLHSMISNPRPTRAEVTDVANAIYSKTDAIMLSGETAYGEYPVEAVQTMTKIAVEVEKSRSDFHEIPIVILSTQTSAYLSKSAVEASIELDAKAIIADTTLGRTILNLSGFRGRKPIHAQCYDKRVVRELALSFGVIPYYLETNTANEFIRIGLTQLYEKKALEKNDLVVIIGGNYGVLHGASFIEISSVENLFKRYCSK